MRKRLAIRGYGERDNEEKSYFHRFEAGSDGSPTARHIGLEPHAV